MAEEPGVNDAEQEKIEVRMFGETALVHGISHYTFDEGAASTRFTTSGISTAAAGRSSRQSVRRQAGLTAHALTPI